MNGNPPQSSNPKLKHSHFTGSYRIYFKDTDTGGVVYHARYIEILEMGRSDWFRALGYSVKALLEKQGLAFPVYELKINYLAPAFLEDLLILELKLEKVQGAKMFFRYVLSNENKITVAEATTTNVLVNIKKSWRPVAVAKTFPLLAKKLG